MKNYQRIGYLLVAAGGICWGSVGVLGNPLFESDLPTLEIVSMKTSLAAFAMIMIALSWQPKLLKIRMMDIPFFILSGLLAQFIFGLGYYSAIRYTGATVAVILLYTAPIYVFIYSTIFFKEKPTREKLLGLVATIIGCFLAVGGLDVQNYDELSMIGILYGFVAAITYASYTIMGKIGTKNYSPFTVATYSLLFGAVLLAIPYPPISNTLYEFDTLKWLSLLGVGIVATLLAFICYTFGLERVESSKASIVVTVEVVAATLLAYYFLNESLTFFRVTGVLMVLVGVITTQNSKVLRDLIYK